ncbi:N-acetylmuramoyl-L-alanine amidase [Staphylococcus pseudintermedius]|uniref:N-acetylmuramoyl-L-alanine amidase n=1 Tax=Staphylococcus TaxID=1279 RepID=UPI00193443D8|nr:N-acetylmuramoyl-L-alanine amidase [Staphylococcus pseudintermedius]EGQ3293761.1 CHAP domain-containing protein [Staphylococcus pseudintermedius]EGQ3835268.1 CHAP domain-containing protein [Staphylococcus pseudintermedius]EGQ4133996.1 CHAP domain-containing protein [Staphylococcus pseudintermedius]EGQ4284562.1 CHAP domain-containing protein [Staphylococcus pseudintermedius]EHK9622957.1 N-acetylmuramoyl-L-alanine amidase [Staphylococcus pseudintermedius]
MMRTYDEAVKWLDNSVGKQFDFDKAYGYQCYDYTNAYFNYMTGKVLYGMFAKNIHTDNKATLASIATVYENTEHFLPQKGDIVIFNGRYGGGCGHTAVVNQATLQSFEVIEQNWLEGGWVNNRPGWEAATRRWHYYDNPMYFIRLHYASKKSVKNIVASVLPSKSNGTKKMKIALVAGHGYNDPGAVGNGTNERDFIRKNIVPNIAKHLRTANHDVYLYGGSTMNQDMYQDTAYGQSVGNYKDYGLYWLKNNQKPDAIVEFHLDAAGPQASGGHVIISSQFKADSIDNKIQSVIKSNVGQIRGVTPRNDLLNVNVSAQINVNYRLAELGFITSGKDMDYIKKNSDKYAKDIAGAIHGKPIGGTAGGAKKAKPKQDKKPPVPTGYKLDKNGVPYKKEKGVYTPTTIKGNNVRKGYSLSSEITGVLANGQSVTYDGAYVINGYRWITYVSNNGRRYIATGKADAKGNRVDYYGRFSKA